MSGNKLNLWILQVIFGEDSYRGAINGRVEVLTKILPASSLETLRSVPYLVFACKLHFQFFLVGHKLGSH